MAHDSLESQGATIESEKVIVKDSMARGEEDMKRSSVNAPDWYSRLYHSLWPRIGTDSENRLQNRPR